MSMSTLVTGATGFIGAALVRQLLGQGDTVRVLSRPQSDHRNLAGLKIEIVYGDLQDMASLHAALKDCHRLYHVAAHYSLWAPDPQLFYKINVEGTRNLMQAAWKAGVERIVYTSTVGALGIPPDGQPGNEETPVSLSHMVGDYKRSKFLAEQAVMEMAKQGLPVVIVNPSAPVGPRDIKPTPTGQMILDFMKGKMWAYLDTGMNLIDVEDVARGHILAMERGRIGQKYILGHKNMTLRKIFETLGKICGIRPPTLQVPYPMALSVAHLNEWVSRWITRKPPRVPLAGVKMAKKYMYFDPSKAIRELGLPQSPIEEALEKAVRWFRGQ
jgi:dihydroflavonol-4-reductase